MISVNNISVNFGGQLIFDEVSFQITPSDRIGLTGRNGAGKSTMLKVLVGEQKTNTGDISFPKDTRIGYLSQDYYITSSKTIFEEARTAFDRVLGLEQDLERIQKEMLERTDYESDAYMDLVHQLSDKQHQLDLIGAHNVEEQIERILKGLGFEQEDMNRSIKEFSGGWQMRVELAKILLQKPDLILLDEPTNHLDIESITWLETFLVNYPGAVMLVSHDRAFLDNVTNRTIEIVLGKIEDYRAGYSKYLRLREERQEKQMQAKKNQDEYIERLEKNIEKFRAKKNKAKFAQSLIKKVEKMERIEVDEFDTSALKIRFPDAPHSGKIVVTADNVSKTYGDNKVIKDESFYINKGERIAFVGKNGMGKTTLSRMIVGDLNYEGKLELGHNVMVGYYAQHQADEMSGDDTLLEVIENAAKGGLRARARGLLGAFLFSGDDVYKKVKVLSGGEKGRLALCKLLLDPFNLLVLDEPTNHLDIPSKEVLKKALKAFTGTVIVVSHDRDFLQGLTDKVFEFRADGIKEHTGDVYDFLKAREVEDFRALELEKQAASKPVEKATSGDKPKNDFKERKEREKELKRLKNKVNNLEKEITKLESQIQEKESQLKDPVKFKEVSADPTFFENYDMLKEKLHQTMEAWEKAGKALSEA